ncbi:hypothetical protein TRFO_08991 [Tritrichomonas foetus]|uniref:Uncharacterized protein n=1 Tax=Tritrichomonas foetus TaxID=1144522 RepID=A0A1J4JKR3_9EUKA|nr:hypothetical protein TRFO_08991 [Tritrichomonas foetus]|eukprot:OHS98149.1 hypothetical protein TRFO_08991 [Tritrichomonas foetus]
MNASATFKDPPEPSEVVQHVDVPELNLLLCGCHPDIYSARPHQRSLFIPGNTQSSTALDESHGSQTARANPHFALYSTTLKDETPPGEIPKTERSENYYKKKQYQTSQFFSRLRQDEEFTKQMSDKLDAYRDCARVKKLVQSQDYEQHYYAPLQYRIKEQFSLKNYKNYLNEKERLIKSMDENPVPIRSPRKLPPIATIRISTNGLRDTTTKYIEHQREEEKLTRFIKKANGETFCEQKVPPINTLDYHMFEVQKETRFAFGNDPEHGNKSGRRVFEGTGTSRVGGEIDMFS